MTYQQDELTSVEQRENEVQGYAKGLLGLLGIDPLGPATPVQGIVLGQPLGGVQAGLAQAGAWLGASGLPR